MGDNILLIGESNDPHIEAICGDLRRLGTNFLLLDTFSTLDRITIKFSNRTEECHLTYIGQKFDFSEVKSIWNSHPISIVVNKKLLNDALEFVHSEWKEGFASIVHAVRSKWVNDPYSIYGSFNRLKQLRLASNIGLRVPKTLITNDVETVESFYAECNKSIIAKTLHSSRGVPEGKLIPSTKIQEGDFRYGKELTYAPCMFQEYIEKKTEYRVTIIGNTIHTAQIFSQNSPKTIHDWRNFDDFVKTPYIPSKLPYDLEEKLLKLMKEMKLNFCTVDLIQMPSDDVVFLELNAQGRWFWIQILTGMNISHDIAKYLVYD